jgi:hypothetical protein
MSIALNRNTQDWHTVKEMIHEITRINYEVVSVFGLVLFRVLRVEKFFVRLAAVPDTYMKSARWCLRNDADLVQTLINIGFCVSQHHV